MLSMYPLTYSEKRTLYEKQLGRCPGCLEKFELYRMQVDHIIPKSRFGSDLSFNLQLLCMSCNLLKGDGNMMELWRKLAEQKRQEETYKLPRWYNLF